MRSAPLSTRLLTIAIAVSYVTLMLANPSAASNLWIPYAIISILMVVIEFFMERHRER